VAWARSVAPLSPQARWIVNELMDEVEHLDKRIRAVDTRLREASGDDSLLKKLMKEPGIGEVTAWALRAFVGRFDRFSTGKQLSRYCGLSPCNASSGTRQADAGLVRGCNRLLRAILIQAGHRLIRTEKRWADLAHTMRGRGKPACVVVAAVANRWMRGLWHRINEEKVTAN